MTERAGPVGPSRLVLLLNNAFASDSRSWKIARSLAAAGWSVTVVARSNEGLPERETRDGFTVVRIAQPRPLRWLPSPRLPEADRGGAASVPGSVDGSVAGPSPETDPRPTSRVRGWVETVVGRPIQAVRYLLLARQWADRIAAVVPTADIWQAEGLITLPVALALRRRAGGRVVYDVRDLQVESSRLARLPGPWRRLLAGRERAWARSADAVLAANQPYADVLAGTLGIKAVVVYNGPVSAAAAVHADDEADDTTDRDADDAAEVVGRPSLTATEVRRRLGLGASTRIVLCLGNVAPGRGIEQLCLAMADVPGATLLVVGPGGAFRDRLAAEAASLPAADRIRFLPAIAPADIPAWTAAADVAAMPIQPTTLNHRLTTPTRLFDALGAGVPIVASDLPGMAGIVRSTGAGLVCDPSDPVAIAAALREVLEAPSDRRATMRAAGLAATRATYAWERQVALLLSVYRDVAVG